MRRQIGERALLRGLEALGHALHAALDRHGHGAYLDRREALAVIGEELDELTREIDDDGPAERVAAEARDLAVAALFLAICEDGG